jgi:hypothetical protein
MCSEKINGLQNIRECITEARANIEVHLFREVLENMWHAIKAGRLTR